MKAHTANRADIDVVPADSAGVDLLIILCGCLRACADKEEVKEKARKHLTIAGESLAGSSQNEDRLASLLAAEVDRLLPPSLSD